MDHLNLPSLRRIIRRTRRLTGKAPVAIVPWNVIDLIARLGFASVASLSWWQSVKLGNVEITLTPAKHWGARKMTDTHRGFGGYVIRSGARSLYHSGDTGILRWLPRDSRARSLRRSHCSLSALTHRTASVPCTPALKTRCRFSPTSRAETMIPMHFGTFCLSAEPMEEPLPRLLAAADKAGVARQMLPLTEGETKVFFRKRHRG